MLPWEKRIPDYLTSRRNTVNFILFTAGFALIFINIYSPFGADKWLNVGAAEFFLYSSIVILIGMLVIVISRILMYLFTKNNSITYAAYGLWIIGEILILALVYALIQWFFLYVKTDFSLVYRNAVRSTSFIIMLPYVISWLYLSFKDKYTILEKLENNLSGDSSRIHDTKTLPGFSMMPFHDEKGILKFSIKKEDVLYIEAADNYVVIHYIDRDKPARYIIRTTLKRIETELPHAGLVRCHRSFMVNIDNVKYIRKEKEGLIIGFESPIQVNVPVSKTYLESVIRKMSNFVETDQ